MEPKPPATEPARRIEILPHFQLETLPEQATPSPFALLLLRSFFAVAGRIWPAGAARLAMQLFTRPRVRARHHTSDYILESARLFDIQYGNLLLKGYEWGSGNETVLLVHGWESRGTALRRFVPGLLKAGFHVVSFDGPAHGDSQGKHTDLIHFAGAIRSVINKVGGVQHAITHSFGGSTLVFTLSYLEPSWRLDKLVLIAAPASTKNVLRDYFNLVGLPGAARRRFRQSLQKRYNYLTFDAIDVESALANAQVGEILVVHDKADNAVPFESAQRIFENQPAAHLLVTQGFGHFNLVKQKPVIERVVQFIAE